MTGYRDMLVDLVLLNFKDFDVILGIDLLTSYYASINYFGKNMTFHILDQLEFSFERKHMVRPLWMISALQASFLLRKSFQGFLAYVVNDENDLKLENIPIIRDYLGVFLDDLLSFC